ncbi:isoquinoline 1-oxidoreductase subunit beta [Adhaeribacter aerolatus]|uniref:Isoquinoline 1-oxidoreductase subunit beta n=1 Tax=Adhaeribacter aerolatus TaxID=670289 RepID=A0A512AVG4_9BACT|nr:molybdopterin cofactor-binding domain-containing protein [Adhaeribacter aerolatus]GEO03709.1 isoquinoline 1-oxidoreductase subunit beta [Adhaeribacter aerolatus]
MTSVNKGINRRDFLKVTALAGGGMLLSFSWLTGCKSTPEVVSNLPKEWFELNSYIKIGDNGLVTLFSPNPEFGQNIKTSLPMLLAEELDVDWKNVVVEQADFSIKRFERQFTGGSTSIQMAWEPLRTAGATARQMLIQAAAQTWQVPASEITTKDGVLHHQKSSKEAGYGEMASQAAKLEVPKEVSLKKAADFKIIGKSKRNVEGFNIVTGKPLFSLDYKHEGMLIAMIVHPPAFGQKIKSVEDSAAKSMPGIKDVFTIKLFDEEFERQAFDITSFNQLAVVVGNTTWEVMQTKKALKVEWENTKESNFVINNFGGGKKTVTVPAGLESTAQHKKLMAEMAEKPGTILRKDGDPAGAFKKAAKVIERTYSAPFLAHNTMEPVNCFAHVTADKAEIYGPIQIPEFVVAGLSTRLGLPKEKIHIRLARMGGGFGQRSYGHHLLEAAIISQKMKAPVKLVYTREDDMTYGIYRPTYMATYKAGLDEKGNLIAYSIKAGGIPEGPLGWAQNRFPAGAVDNYLAEEWVLNSNITMGTFRAPRSNFLGGAEQSFLDEVAELAGKDPIDFRLELFDRAKNKPVGKENNYDPDRYAGVLKLVRDKSDWKQTKKNVHRGVSAYFCHNTYVAEVIDLSMQENKPVVEKVYAAVDCGVVVNPDAAINMGQGGIIDGIGNALYGGMTFQDGVPQKNNFDKYRLIRHSEAPKAIEIHFVKSEENPTGLGEPLFPPIFAALANALYKATGKREYDQPFLQVNEQPV